MAGRGPQRPASIRSATMTVGPDGQEGGPAEALSPPGRGLVWGKLAPPALPAGLLPRVGLASLLQTGAQARLCLLAAPAGSGKTTLLGQWRAAAGGDRVAWVWVDTADNDPLRFWTCVVEALRAVEPRLGTAALEALRGSSVDLDRVVLPLLLGELAAAESQLVLVLDDYHLVTDATCLHTLGVFLEQLPTGVHVVLATQVDPPLQLATLRARGQLAELRAAELQFTSEEASELLNGAMGLDLAGEDVARPVERTEGWAAGLVLAGLALRGRQDPSAFVALFHGDDRHVAGFLVAEVLARQPEVVRAFLLRTSVLERLSGPSCDAVLETEASAELLGELEASNLLLVPLDDRREWYRYQQPFGELLRLELSYREPALVPVPHRRAAAWYRRAGNLDEPATTPPRRRARPSQCAKPAQLVGELARQATASRWLEAIGSAVPSRSARSKARFVHGVRWRSSAGCWRPGLSADGCLLLGSPGKHRRQRPPDLVDPRPQQPPVPPGCQRLILGIHGCDQFLEQAADLDGPVVSLVVGGALGQQVPLSQEVDQGGPQRWPGQGPLPRLLGGQDRRQPGSDGGAGVCLQRSGLGVPGRPLARPPDQPAGDQPDNQHGQQNPAEGSQPLGLGGGRRASRRRRGGRRCCQRRSRRRG
jgi:hypothetical protein